MSDLCMCNCNAVMIWGQASLSLSQLGVIKQAAQESFYNDLISNNIILIIKALQACNEFYI